MQAEYKLSFITVNYNGLEDTCALIDSIISLQIQSEVIVVDNGSKTNEAAIISQRYPTPSGSLLPCVTAIRSEENLGFAGGNNLGIKSATGDFLFFINNDTVIDDVTKGLSKHDGEHFDKIELLIRRMESDPNIGMICPKIRFFWEPQPIQFAGYTPLTTITMRNSAIGFNEMDNGQYNTAHPTPYAHGAAMLVSRKALQHAGMMPECYFLYYEELDWSVMFRRAGFTIWYDPGLTIYHKESKSTGQNSPLRTYYITRNRLLFARRNLSCWQRPLTYLYLIGLVMSRDIIKYITQRRFDLMKAAFAGVRDFICGRQGVREK